VQIRKHTSDHWQTPDKIYKQLDDEFHFDFDPCPLHADFDGLAIKWGKRNYVNPPYTKTEKEKFIRKAYLESLNGNLSVMLLPVSTSSYIFHEVIKPYAEVRFVKGRLSFCGNKNAGFDSMIVIFRPKSNGGECDESENGKATAGAEAPVDSPTTKDERDT
jgi:site-specific DNA-methyltransferase (adenine-specific)